MSMWWNHDPIRELRARIRRRRDLPRDKGEFPRVNYRLGYRGLWLPTRKNTAFVDRGCWALRLDHRGENFCNARGFYPKRSHTNHPKKG